MYDFVECVKMGNLSEDELNILLAVAHSKDSECDYKTLVRTLNLTESRANYYLSRLSFEKKYLFWIGSPGESDRYRLTDRGRKVLLEGSYI
jgi:predicted transcriptional regulator